MSDRAELEAPTFRVYGPGGGHGNRIEEYFSRFGPQPAPKPDRDYTTYVVCFTNRCGSNLLCQTLTATGLLGDPQEYFNYPFVKRMSKKRGIRSLAEYAVELQADRSSANAVFGTKLGAGQLLYLAESGVIPHVLERPHFVWVRRRDVLAQAVSLSIATQTSQWTSESEGDRTADYDEVDILRRLRMITSANAQFEYFFGMCAVQPLILEYEDFCDDLLGTARAVADQLGVTERIDVPAEAITLTRQRNELNELFEAKIRASYRMS